MTKPIRIAIIYFAEITKEEKKEENLSPEKKKELLLLAKERNPSLTEEEFERLLSGMDHRFLLSLQRSDSSQPSIFSSTPLRRIHANSR